MQGPFEVDLKIRVRAGENTAIVTYGLPAGQYPTKESIQEALEASLKATQEQLPGQEVRLLNRPEFQNEVLAERTGHYIEFASPDDWDD